MPEKNAAVAAVVKAVVIKEETKENAALTNLQEEATKVEDAHLTLLPEEKEDHLMQDLADARERKAVAAAAALKVQ